MSESPTAASTPASGIPAPSPPVPVATLTPTLPPSTTLTPTLHPSVPPSASPSRIETLVAGQGFATQLYVNEARQMTPIEQEIFRGILESHTLVIGAEVGEPFIATECTILQEQLGTSGAVSDDGQDRTVLLQVTYLMNWTSRYGYEEIADYPTYFRDYMDAFGGETLDLLRETLDITGVVFVEDVGSTAFVNVTSLLAEKENAAQVGGTSLGQTSKPTAIETAAPSAWPSEAPSIFLAPSSSAVGSENKRQGALIGILVACVALIVGVMVVTIMRRNRMKEMLQQEDGDSPTTDAKSQDATKSQMELNAAQDQFPGGIQIAMYNERDSGGGNSNNDAEAGTMSTPETARMTQQTSLGSAPKEMFASDRASKGVMYPTIDSLITVGSRWPNQMKIGEIDDTISRENTAEASEPTTEQLPGANLLAARSESFSTNSLDGTLSSNVSAGGGDEFDRYKNQVLEKLRSEVEESVEGVEGMLSLAIARVFIEDHPLDMEWIGGEDLGSIEASCLCRAFEWERRGDSTVTGRSFFEDQLNKVVLIVHHGLIRPNDGARILHGCASIVGLPLVKDPPNATLLIQGLIKTNDLAQGHDMLVETFSPFGDIVDASIAPQNRGFGFVRFVKPKSVGDVLKQHDRAEIEIQDVAVTIHSLYQASF